MSRMAPHPRQKTAEALEEMTSGLSGQKMLESKTVFLGEGNDNPLQYPCLESLDTGAWWSCVVIKSPWGRKESGTTERLTLTSGEKADI